MKRIVRINLMLAFAAGFVACCTLIALGLHRNEETIAGGGLLLFNTLLLSALAAHCCGRSWITRVSTRWPFVGNALLMLGYGYTATLALWTTLALRDAKLYLLLEALQTEPWSKVLASQLMLWIGVPIFALGLLWKIVLPTWAFFTALACGLRLGQMENM